MKTIRFLIGGIALTVILYVIFVYFAANPSDVLHQAKESAKAAGDSAAVNSDGVWSNLGLYLSQLWSESKAIFLPLLVPFVLLGALMLILYDGLG